jgi:hypothetical protein
MKNPDRDAVSKLEELPNIGKSIANHLLIIGIVHPKQLLHQDPFKMYKQLCEKTHTRIDPCVLDVFISVVDFMEGNEPRPWWKYTKQRKSLFKREEDISV